MFSDGEKRKKQKVKVWKMKGKDGKKKKCPPKFKNIYFFSLETVKKNVVIIV